MTPTRLLAALSLCLLAGPLLAAEPPHPQCLAPASPGGSFDLTCQILRKGLEQAGLLKQPMAVSYYPGGVGAVAYNAVVTQRPSDPNTLVVWSSGSLMNLALGKFGRLDENAVRWLAAIGASYGAIAVRSDSPFHSLGDFLAALKKDPANLLIGSGGTLGSQDWVQVALLAKMAGIDPRQMRYVALEGGGEIATALLHGHLQAASTDISDSMPHIRSGAMRILAVFSERRLDGPDMVGVPTAREQGYDLVWPVVRGLYLGPEVSDSQYAWWKDRLDALLANEDFNQLRSQEGMFPFALTGSALDAYVKRQVALYKALARDLELLPPTTAPSGIIQGP